MRSSAFPKVYRSFEEFERDELRKLDLLHQSIDELIDDMFGELEFDENGKRKRAEPGEDE
jgi:hypothetical protein